MPEKKDISFKALKALVTKRCPDTDRRIPSAMCQRYGTAVVGYVEENMVMIYREDPEKTDHWDAAYCLQPNREWRPGFGKAVALSEDCSTAAVADGIGTILVLNVASLKTAKRLGEIELSNVFLPKIKEHLEAGNKQPVSIHSVALNGDGGALAVAWAYGQEHYMTIFSRTDSGAWHFEEEFDAGGPSLIFGESLSFNEEGSRLAATFRLDKESFVEIYDIASTHQSTVIQTLSFPYRVLDVKLLDHGQKLIVETLICGVGKQKAYGLTTLKRNRQGTYDEEVYA